jgi:hypothetical protein
MSAPRADHHEQISLCEALDRLLHRGVVLRGEIAISVADVDLVYLGLQVLLASTDTARDFCTHTESRRTHAFSVDAVAQATYASTAPAPSLANTIAARPPNSDCAGERP